MTEAEFGMMGLQAKERPALPAAGKVKREAWVGFSLRASEGTDSVSTLVEDL